LDKIIDRAAGSPAIAAEPPRAPREAAPVYQPEPNRGSAPAPRRRDDDDDYERGGYKKKRRESFLGELFDF
jgi:Zn-finger nucleic acid-binding protein